MKRIVRAVVLLFLAGTIQACAVAAVFPLFPLMGTAYMGYVAWKGNKAIKYYSDDIETVHWAVIQTYTQMKLKVDILNTVPKKKYALATKGNYPMKVDIEAVETNVTKVAVDIGFTGDKQFAEFFYKTIDEHLAKRKAESVKNGPAHEPPKEVPKETVKEVPKEPAVETPAAAPREAPQEVLKQPPAEVPKEVPKEAPKEPPKEALPEAPKPPAEPAQ